MSYILAIQATRSKKYCVCFVSRQNGKLVLKGEPLNRRIDAFAIAEGIGLRMNVATPAEVLPYTHKWPKNSGKKKAAIKKKPSIKFKIDNTSGYSRVKIVRVRKAPLKKK